VGLSHATFSNFSALSRPCKMGSFLRYSSSVSKQLGQVFASLIITNTWFIHARRLLPPYRVLHEKWTAFFIEKYSTSKPVFSPLKKPHVHFFSRNRGIHELCTQHCNRFITLKLLWLEALEAFKVSFLKLNCTSKFPNYSNEITWKKVLVSFIYIFRKLSKNAQK